MASGNHLYDLFEAAIPRRDKTFIELPEGDCVSFGDVFDLAAHIATGLLARDLTPGDRVAVQVEKTWQALALYLATLRAGGVFLPLNTAYTNQELEYFLADAEPHIFVCDPTRKASAAGIAKRAGVNDVETLDITGTGTILDVPTNAPAAEPAARTAEDPASILYTSGTTGRSKGAVLSHGNLASNAAALVDLWRFNANDTLLHALPIFHIHGLFVATNVSLLSGAKMLFLPRFDIEEIMRLIPRSTVMMGVPTFYNRMITREDLCQDLCARMRLFISGSAPLSAEVHKEFAARTGHAILERYGMTETGMNSSNPYDGTRRAGTVGMPLPEVHLRITAPETGAVLKMGEIGMIEVQGPNVFSGYWRMPEKTKAEFRNGYFITGDMGLIDAQGYVSIVGREKDLIITGGLNVYPAEVESAIDEISGVAECAVIGVPHNDFGEGVVAVVAPRNDADLTESDIIQSLQTQIANFKQPKCVIFVDQLPRNTMGKIEKENLRQTYTALFTG
jgi:malonyl-CoA/methylmalonyl-CoA synthetase